VPLRGVANVVEVVPLRIENADYKFDRLREKIPGSSALSIVPGLPLTIMAVTTLPSVGDSIRLDVKEASGAGGSLVVTRVRRRLLGELQLCR